MPSPRDPGPRASVPSRGGDRPRRPRLTVWLSLCLSLSMLAGCAGSPIQRRDGTQSQRGYSLSNLAKSDVDMISELTQREVLNGLKLLTLKLYRRNPQEYRKAGFDNPEAAAARIFSNVGKGPRSPLAFVDWRDRLQLAFQEDYVGDRVHVLMEALTAMILAAYEHKTEFYLTDTLDAQKLYNSARNIEVAVWKLSTARLANGQRMLLSNSMEGEAQNLSFEREFGKLIAHLALIMEERGHRAINRIMHNVAAFVFLPI
jgi:hypothetical protein